MMEKTNDHVEPTKVESYQTKQQQILHCNFKKK